MAKRTRNPVELFADLLEQDGEFPLLQAAASVALDVEPDLDLQEVQARFEALASECQSWFKRPDPRDFAARRAWPRDPAEELSRFFYAERGFRGDPDDFADPDECHMHRVLQTRRGDSLSLGMLYMALAARVGVSVEGIIHPKGMLMRVFPGGVITVIQPWNGNRLSRDDTLEYLEWQFGHGGSASREALWAAVSRAARPQDMLAVMLSKLIDTRTYEGDWPRVLALQDRLVMLRPLDWGLRRHRGDVLHTLGHIKRARADYKACFPHLQDASERAHVQSRMKAAKAGSQTAV